MIKGFKEKLESKKKIVIPSILMLVLIIGGAVYGINHNEPVKVKKHTKKVERKFHEKTKEEKPEEAAPVAKSEESSKTASNPKPEKKSETKNSSAKSVAQPSSGSSSSTSSTQTASKAKEPIYGTRTVQKAVQVYDPMKESYIQCACGCKNPSYEHGLAHMRNGEPNNTRRVYVGGYVTKYETVTERYIIGYR